jgi:hypothetical protein
MSLSDIARDFGRDGLQVADELCNAGVVSLVNGTLFGTFGQKEVKPSIQYVRQHGHLHLELIDEVPGFRMENPFGGLNEQGIKKTYELLDDFIAEIYNIMKDPMYKGNIMYLVTILGGLMSLPRDKEPGQ